MIARSPLSFFVFCTAAAFLLGGCVSNRLYNSLPSEYIVSVAPPGEGTVGVDVAIIEVDEFGSGRASVVALQRINPDRLKIDRRLVSLVAEGSGGLRLLRSIIEIGQALELGVTAEGVETHEQAEILTRLGCDRLQGYYFARPMAFSDLLKFLETPDSLLRGA